MPRQPRNLSPISRSSSLTFAYHTRDVQPRDKKRAMSRDPAQPSANEVDENLTELSDNNHETMDLMSLIFRSLDLREEKRVSDDVTSVEVENRSSTYVDIKSPKNDRRRARRRRDDNVDSIDESANKTLDSISLDQLAWHDSADDCWIAIYDYVYDVTEFVASHPGGEDVLLEYAGRDATLAFIGTGHSNSTRKILDKYLIGELPACERIFRITDGVKIVQQ